jgi:predicted ATPase/class 3 adenylate cyclase
VQATGAFTFLLTDVEGSTRLWEREPEATSVAIGRLGELISSAVEHHGGALPKAQGEGDGALGAFTLPSDAIACALDLQRRIRDEPWPHGIAIRIRIALHTGEAEMRDGDYFGQAVNRCARLRAIAHGGQTLVSAATYELARHRCPPDARFSDAGAHRLKDLTAPEHVYELHDAGRDERFPPLRSLDAHPHNLPVQLTSFVGRGDEAGEIRKLLSANRVVTLTGVGGVGKTRLALHVAAELTDRYPLGVWFVDLAPLQDPFLVPAALGAALGLREDEHGLSVEVIAEHLRERTVLVVLDNCEHLVEVCAYVADRLLRACPDLTMLATSRQPLGVAGEVVWRVPPMAVPDPSAVPPTEALAGFEATRLFVERAGLARAGFSVSHESAPAVAEICRRLDGIPLAIELAAARVAHLGPEQIAARLDDRFRLLRSGRAVQPRQQTLRGLIDWSHDLLSDGERVLLRRLAVFAGSFSLEGAEEVCAGDGLETADVLDLLSSLVDRSLVALVEQPGDVRYRLLESIHEYASEKLTDSGEADVCRRAHLSYFLSFAERASRELAGPRQAEWLVSLSLDHDNLRAALATALQTQLHTCVRLCVALESFWRIRCHLSEGRSWLGRALEEAQGIPDGPPCAGAARRGAAGRNAVGPPVLRRPGRGRPVDRARARRRLAAGAGAVPAGLGEVLA